MMLVGKNLGIAAVVLLFWLLLVTTETWYGRIRWLDYVYLASVVVLSFGLWLANRPLAELAASREFGVILVAVLSAVLTAIVVVAGAVISERYKALITGL